MHRKSLEAAEQLKNVGDDDTSSPAGSADEGGRAVPPDSHLQHPAQVRAAGQGAPRRNSEQAASSARAAVLAGAGAAQACAAVCQCISW